MALQPVCRGISLVQISISQSTAGGDNQTFIKPLHLLHTHNGEGEESAVSGGSGFYGRVCACVFETACPFKSMCAWVYMFQCGRNVLRFVCACIGVCSSVRFHVVLRVMLHVCVCLCE